MCGLQGPEPDNNPKPIPTPAYAGIARPGTGSPMVHKNGPQKRVPPNSDEERRRMKDRLQNLLRTVRIPGNALPPNKRTFHVP